MENCFALHPKKCLFFERKKTLEAKLGALEERLENLASSDQIFESLVPPEAKASSSTPDYYMFGASGNVVSLAAMTRTQFMLQAPPMTTGEPVETSWARNNGLADQIDQARVPLSFELADAVQFICRAPLHEESPKHHGHKGDLGVTPGTCGGVGKRTQVILVCVRFSGVGNASHPRRLGGTRVGHDRSV